MNKILLSALALMLVCAAIQGGWMIYGHTATLAPVFYLVWFSVLLVLVLAVAAGTLAIAALSCGYLFSLEASSPYDMAGSCIMGFIAWAFSWMFMLQVNVLGQPMHASAANAHGMRALTVGAWLVLWALCGLKASITRYWRQTAQQRAQNKMARQLKAICKDRKLTPEQRQQALDRLFRQHLRLSR